MGRVMAIIPSAGRGLRMGLAVEKPYILIGDRPLLAHTLDAFERCPEVDGYVLVVEPERLDACRRQVVEAFGYTRVCGIVPGGETRQASVYRGLLALGPDVDLVVVHDAARPCVSPEIIRSSVRQGRRYGAAVVAVPVKDTVKVVRDGMVQATPDRSTLWLAQTPQTFTCLLLKAAHERALQEGHTGTDDAALVERLGHPVAVVPGDYENLKITTPEDLEAAERILRRRAAS
jgi:2-C-methyl-D-erythritol 4-phosphate cytidylyltransferase